MTRKQDTRSRKTIRRAATIAFILAGSGLGLGCARPLPPAIGTDTELGQVIIYRNGVAYFERYAAAGETELTLVVPSERVDDFLKSLTVVDEKDGKTMPVSFPTMVHRAGEVVMTIKLPKHHSRLRITYVTESPAWKPSYRVMLSEDGKAKLQGWAVVDNVSGEDWENVRIGVGSTSALSFRYDLHSVRLVERERLSSGSLVAVAPPAGGTPYAAGGKKKRVVGGLSQSGSDELQAFATVKQDASKPKRVVVTESRVALGDPHGRATGGARQPRANAPAPPPNAYRPRSRAESEVDRLAGELNRSGDRFVVEGFAKEGDKNARESSLARANLLREQLIARGVDPDRVDAVGTGEVNNDQAAQLVTASADGRDTKPGDTGVLPHATTDDGQPLGQAHFVSTRAMTITSDHSAMVNILDEETMAERVYYYDPVSNRGSKKFAFNAVRVVNPSRYTLDSGPFTVYRDGQFLGEGMSEPILPHSIAFIPFALDRSIIADPEVSMREEIDRLLTIQRGIVTSETRQIRKTKLTLSNRGKESAKIYVRHRVAEGYKLGEQHKGIEKLGGAHLFPVTVAGGDAVELEIEEWTPVRKTVDIRSDAGVASMALFLKKGNLDSPLQAALDAIVAGHKARADLEEKINVLEDQMRVYRTRVDEINVQLVTLKKVPQAAKLRRHLTEKMLEISERLQKATMDLTDLKGQHMTLRIELQDKLAELTLKQDDAEEQS